MEIKIIGAGCKECDRLWENTCKALEELGQPAAMERVSDLVEIVKLGVMTAPSMLLDGRLVVSGQVPSVQQLGRLIAGER